VVMKLMFKQELLEIGKPKASKAMNSSSEFDIKLHQERFVSLLP
jgi:hypothetical protein